MSTHNIIMFSWRNKKGTSNEYPKHMFSWRNKKGASNDYLQHGFFFGEIRKIIIWIFPLSGVTWK